MRAHEIINENFVGNIYLPNMELAVNDHAYDQADFRRVKYDLVDRIIKKVNAVAPELSKIAANEKVWVYDPETNIGFGLRRIFQNKMTFQFNTVLNDRPYDSAVKVIELPSNAPDVKAMNSFVNIGQNTVRKIAPEPKEPVAIKVEPSVSKPAEPVPKLPAIEPNPIKKAATAAVRNIPKYIKYIK
jgi:hypothetical protein